MSGVPARRPGDVLLASGFTVTHYRRAVVASDRAVLAAFVHRRFSERYVEPTGGVHRHGFTIMAVSCLMIESLVAFRNGWNTTQEDGRNVFGQFFRTYSEFAPLVPFAASFNRHVRNGLLHQAETTGGWRIRRDRSALFDPASKTIEADKFRSALGRALSTYRDELSASPWDSPLWSNFRDKVDAICRNAGLNAASFAGEQRTSCY